MLHCFCTAAAKILCKTVLKAHIIKLMLRAVYRIIDANFNRAREAARVMEEFCRFVLNCEPLSSRAKQLRHRLCAAVQGLDAELLIGSRDVDGDVGRQMRVDQQLSRRDLRDCFIAAAKRLTEALRVLAETSQTIEPAIAETFEELRFTAYKLEKDVLVLSSSAEKFGSVRLYIVITATAQTGDSQIQKLALDCAKGGADCIQLRAKGLSDARTFKLAGELVKICRDGGVISIVNDRVDIAATVGADGVHVGQDDLSISEGRKLQLRPMVFGLSTHSISELNAAIAQRPDYVGLGAIFPTETKSDVNIVGVEYVSKAVKLLAGSGIGHVAIGGITLENVDNVLKAGAKAVAVCSAVRDAADSSQMCRRLKDKILAHQQ